MSRRVVLTCRACNFIIATRERQATLFGWRFEDGRHDALCPECVTPRDDAGGTSKRIPPPLGLVRQATEAWHGELLRRSPARFLRLERGSSPRVRQAGLAAPERTDSRK
jgi:hypothetical protein